MNNTHKSIKSSLSYSENQLRNTSKVQLASKPTQGERAESQETHETEKRPKEGDYRLQVPSSSEASKSASRGYEGGKPNENEDGKKFRETSQAYLQDYLKVTKAAYEYIDGLLRERGIGQHSTRLFKHVLSSGSLPTSEGGWVPVPARLMQRKIPNADWKLLRNEGLLEVKNYTENRCREYRVPFEIRQQFEAMNSFTRSGYVNLFTGRPTTRTLKNEKTKENPSGNPTPVPDLVRDAMAAIPTGYINTETVFLHLAELDRKYRRAQNDLLWADLTGADPEEIEAAEKAMRRFRGRLTTDQAAWHSIVGQGLKHVRGPIYAFSPAYRATRTGRLTAQRSLLQSCSREMKEAAFTAIPEMHNYDIKSSQMVILSDYFQEAGIQCEWLDSYVENDRAKYEWSERAGLSVDTWKSCLYALLMGAKPHKSGFYTRDIWENLTAEYPDEDEAYEKLQQFKAATKELRSALNEWHEHLVNEWYPQNERWGRALNDVGMPIRKKGFIDEGKLNVGSFKRALAAHLLQGREALFIHNLVLLSRTERFDFRVISHQHDGLVTIGAIPQEAVDEIKQDAAMEYVRLEDKPFL